MAFEIGAISGRLELDRNPFTEGLRLARAQADEFQRNKINVPVDADTATADAKFEATQAELDRLDHTRANPKVDTDTTHARGQVGLLATAIIALGPAALAAGGLAAGALAPIAVGAAGVALVALPALKNIHDAATKTGDAQAKALANIGPGGAQAVAAFQGLERSWKGFQGSVNPAVLGLLSQTFRLIEATLPAFAPFITATAHSIAALVAGLVPLAPAFGRAFSAMSPIVTLFNQGLLHIAQSLAQWTAGQGFQHFISYIVTNGPLLVHTIGAFASALVQIAIAAGPMLPVMLHLATAFAQIVAALAKIPGLVPLLTGAFIAYKLAALASVAATKIALLGLFGPALQAQMVARAAAVGTASGTALGLSFATKAGLVVAAGIAGWEIGGWLRRHVPVVQSAGDFLGRQFGEAFFGGTQLEERINQAILDMQTKSFPALAGQIGAIGAKALGAAAGTPAAAPALAGGGILAAAPAKHVVAAKPTEGFNSLTDRIEFHTSAQWTHIYALEAKQAHDRSLAGASPVGAGAAPVAVARGVARAHHVTNTVNRAHHPYMPRSVANDFALGPDVVGQAVVYHHPAQARTGKTRGESLQQEGNRHLKKISEELQQQGRHGAEIVVKANPGGRADQIDTSIRRRGHTGGKK